MAIMFPSYDENALEQVLSRAEREVYRAFRDQVTKDLIVVHSLDLVGGAAGGAKRDLEADFVVFDPEHGFLVVEVKGGGISFDAVCGEWSSLDRHRNHHKIKDPLSQAKVAKYEILRHLKASRTWPHERMPRIGTAHAALLVDLDDVNPLVGPGRPRELLGSRGDLAKLNEWIARVFEFSHGPDSSLQGLGALGMKIVQKMFCASVTIHVPLVTSIERESLRQIELTQRQARVLRMLKHRRRAVIAGGAGTGKTLLAIEHAKALAAQGLHTLLVCYNRALGVFLDEQTRTVERLEATSFHHLCRLILDRVKVAGGLNWEKEITNEYPRRDPYDVILPLALASAAEEYSPLYDVIIVDEGQDFAENYWLALEMLLANGDESSLYVFCDQNQSLYHNQVPIPLNEPPLLLTENCRNTHEIHEFAYRYYSGEAVDPPDVQGAKPELLEATGTMAQARAIKKFVRKLMEIERIAPEDICVLILSKAVFAFEEALKSSGEPNPARWSFREMWEPGTILVDSVRRFKGLESPVVILWGFEEFDHTEDRADLYVGTSRARSRLWLVGERGLVEAAIGFPLD